MSSRLDSRTGLDFFIKQPAESRKYTFDFTALLGQQIIDTVVSVVAENQRLIKDSTELTVGAPVDDGAAFVQVRLEDGQHREDYKITATITDNGGNTLQGEGLIKVRDL